MTRPGRSVTGAYGHHPTWREMCPLVSAVSDRLLVVRKSSAAENLTVEAPSGRDAGPLVDLAAALAEADEQGEAVVVRAGTRELPLPGPARDLLAAGVSQLAGGRRVALVSADEELTTQAAADLLGISRPYLVKLLRDGALPHRKVGNRHRLHMSDV